MSGRRVAGAGAGLVVVTMVVMVVTMAACAAHGRQGTGDTTPDPAAPDTSARGRVRVVGAAPATATVLESGGRRIALIGPRSAELATLEGAEVTVHGPASAGPAWLGGSGRAITVRGYEIEEIAGGKPVVGVLVADSVGLRVDSVRLVEPPEELQRLVGRKVWVVGERIESGAMRVGAYGVVGGERGAPRRP